MVFLDISDKGRIYAKIWSYFRARRGVEVNELICLTAADRAGRRARSGALLPSKRGIRALFC